MRAISAVFILLCLTGILAVHLLSSSSDEDISPPVTPEEKYIRIRENRFINGDSVFYPKVINFPISLRMGDTSMWPAVYIGYL